MNSSDSEQRIQEQRIQEQTRNLMDAEYLKRTKSASLIFALVAIFYGLDGLEVQYRANEMRGLCLCAALINLVRLILAFGSTKLKYNKLLTFMSHTKLLTLVNGVLWSLIFTIILSENLQLSHIFSIVVLTAAAYAAASILTLNMYFLLSVIFQGCVLMPLAFFCFQDFYVSGRQQDLYLPVLISIFYVFCVYQTRIVRQHMLERFRKEIELNYAIQDLQDSQKKIIEQTNKTIHASRLASLGEMAGGIAHEVNNPLAVIYGHVQQLTRELQKNSEVNAEYLKAKVAKIATAVERISKIIKGLRQFSQQSDQEPMASAQLSTIIQETLDMCGEKFLNNSIQLSVSGEQSVMVNCRSVQISQILINLLNNAYDAIKEESPQGQIWIDCQTHASQNGSEIRVQVANSGKPIALEIRGRLFQPFYSTKEIGKGTGLGLSISRGIARDHGGDLYLLEDLQRTTFELRLPLQEKMKFKGAV